MYFKIITHIIDIETTVFRSYRKRLHTTLLFHINFVLYVLYTVADILQSDFLLYTLSDGKCRMETWIRAAVVAQRHRSSRVWSANLRFRHWRRSCNRAHLERRLARWCIISSTTIRLKTKFTKRKAPRH